MTTALDQILGGKTGPYIHLLAAPDAGRNEWLARLQAAATESRPGALVRRLHGERCQNSAGFFAEMARALEFPDYFGHNWAALADCLTDMGWLPASAYLLAMSNAEELFSASSEQAWRTLGDLINEETADETTPLHLVLATEQAETLAERLTAAGVQFRWVSEFDG